MTEELIAQLGLWIHRVSASSLELSAMQFKKTTKRADQIGSELGVSHLLEGQCTNDRQSHPRSPCS
jgi:TolB-like protein